MFGSDAAPTHYFLMRSNKVGEYRCQISDILLDKIFVFISLPSYSIILMFMWVVEYLQSISFTKY